MASDKKETLKTIKEEVEKNKSDSSSISSLSDLENDSDDQIPELAKSDIAVPDIDEEAIKKLRNKLSGMDMEQLNKLMMQFTGQNLVNPSDRDYSGLSKRERLLMKLREKKMTLRKGQRQLSKRSIDMKIKKAKELDKKKTEDVDDNSTKEETKKKTKLTPEERKRLRNKKRRLRKKKKLAEIRAKIKADKNKGNEDA